MAVSTEWQVRAACRGCGPQLWFDEDNSRPAIKVCMGCEVREECLEWAIDHPFHTRCGVWGGLPERGRRALRQARGLYVVPPIPSEPAECGTVRGYKQHRKDDTKVCEPCRSAWAEHHRQRRAADRMRVRV